MHSNFRLLTPVSLHYSTCIPLCGVTSSLCTLSEQCTVQALKETVTVLLSISRIWASRHWVGDLHANLGLLHSPVPELLDALQR